MFTLCCYYAAIMLLLLLSARVKKVTTLINDVSERQEHLEDERITDEDEEAVQEVQAVPDVDVWNEDEMHLPSGFTMQDVVYSQSHPTDVRIIANLQFTILISCRS